jgi:regulatory protein
MPDSAQHDYAQIRESAMGLLARREHSQLELLQKLNQKIKSQKINSKNRGFSVSNSDEVCSGEVFDREVFDREAFDAQDVSAEGISIETIIQSVIDDLATEGLQSDERFTEVYVRSYIQKGQGPTKIRMNLKQLGIESHLIDEYLYSEDIDWYENIKTVFSRKFSHSELMDSKQKSRVYRFLQSRGFTQDQISSLI